jgi:peptidoglycan/LPS O-acetylase OafA/YrhL
MWAVIGALMVLGLANGTGRLNALRLFGTLSYRIYVFHFLAVLVLAGRSINAQ